MFLQTDFTGGTGLIQVFDPYSCLETRETLSTDCYQLCWAYLKDCRDIMPISILLKAYWWLAVRCGRSGAFGSNGEQLDSSRGIWLLGSILQHNDALLLISSSWQPQSLGAWQHYFRIGSRATCGFRGKRFGILGIARLCHLSTLDVAHQYTHNTQLYILNPG